MSGDIWHTASTEPDNAEYLAEASEVVDGVFDEDGDAVDRCHWHESEAELRELSKKFPGVTLLVKCEGVDQGDLWEEKYIDGEQHERNPTTLWTEFKQKEQRI